MKFKLGPLENTRTFYTPKGNTTVIRDTFVNQIPSPQPESIKETEVEIKTDEEPILEISAEEIFALKNTKKKNERYKHN
jgi:hypothetical protein